MDAERQNGRDDAVDELAELLGMDPVQLVHVLGAGWRRESDLPDGSSDRWLVSGEPPQIAVGYDGFVFALARPAPCWAGVTHLEWHFDGEHRFAAEDLIHDSEALAEKAEEIARGRRRSFRWCRTCRQVTAPEWFLRGEGVCMGCASAHHGTVF